MIFDRVNIVTENLNNVRRADGYQIVYCISECNIVCLKNLFYLFTHNRNITAIQYKIVFCVHVSDRGCLKFHVKELKQCYSVYNDALKVKLLS